MDEKELSAAFTAIAQKQDELNKVVNPEWVGAGYEWYRALWNELSEGMGYIRWSWWKKGPEVPDGTNLLHLYLELADCLHFGVSMHLVQDIPDFGDTSLAYTHVGAVLARNALSAQNPGGVVEGITVADVLERVAKDALNRHEFDGASFFRACSMVGLSTPTLIAYYHGKGVLNHFRQENGYKQGTYRKMWAGTLGNHEDNLYLADLIESYRKNLDDAGLLESITKGNFARHIRMNLSMVYHQLPTERRQS